MKYNVTSKFLLLLFVFFILASCSSNRFTLKQRKLIKQTSENNIMPLMLVSNPGDSVILYQKSNSVVTDSTNKLLNKLVTKMYATVRNPENPGVGIAAPQIGINKRIIWVQRFDKPDKPFEVYFNSKIVNYSSSESEGREGCLSIPGYYGFVNRSDTITVNYDLFNQQNITDTITGFTAIIFQHETDHLEGILYTDRIIDTSKLKKKTDE